MGCELSRQLREPAEGCGASIGMFVVAVAVVVFGFVPRSRDWRVRFVLCYQAPSLGMLFDQEPEVGSRLKGGSRGYALRMYVVVCTQAST
jgi:hypothetical protein